MMPPPGHDANLDRAFAQAMKEKRYAVTLGELGESWVWDGHWALACCLLANGRFDLLLPLLEAQRETLANSKVSQELLSYVVRCRDKVTVRILTSAGIPLAGSSLFPILHFGDAVDFLHFLVEQGANLVCFDEEGNSFLHAHANQQVEKDWVGVLVGYGVPLEHRNQRRFTALQEACYCGNVAYVRALLDVQADRFVVTENGATLLHVACYGILDPERRRAMVRFLLKNGLDPSVPNHDGKTPLDFARHFGHTNLVALFSSQPVK